MNSDEYKLRVGIFFLLFRTRTELLVALDNALAKVFHSVRTRTSTWLQKLEDSERYVQVHSRNGWELPRQHQKSFQKEKPLEQYCENNQTLAVFGTVQVDKQLR